MGTDERKVTGAHPLVQVNPCQHGFQRKQSRHVCKADTSPAQNDRQEKAQRPGQEQRPPPPTQQRRWQARLVQPRRWKRQGSKPTPWGPFCPLTRKPGRWRAPQPQCGLRRRVLQRRRREVCQGAEGESAAHPRLGVTGAIIWRTWRHEADTRGRGRGRRRSYTAKSQPRTEAPGAFRSQQPPQQE